MIPATKIKKTAEGDGCENAAPIHVRRGSGLFQLHDVGGEISHGSIPERTARDPGRRRRETEVYRSHEFYPPAWTG